MITKRFVVKNGLDNNSQTIINILDPVLTQDAATKNYVDSRATNSNTGDETAITIKNKLGIVTLSGANTGDQINITGNAGTATLLQTARNINGISFNGSADITVNAVDVTARIASSLVGAMNGVASLDASGKVPAIQLPSYVDDVLEYANLTGFPTTGETGKIYIALDTNRIYRWSGSTYIYITSGAATGAPGNSVFVETDQVVTGDYTITAGKNAMSAGPISINTGVTVTVPTGAVWSIV